MARDFGSARSGCPPAGSASGRPGRPARPGASRRTSCRCSSRPATRWPRRRPRLAAVSPRRDPTQRSCVSVPDSARGPDMDGLWRLVTRARAHRDRRGWHPGPDRRPSDGQPSGPVRTALRRLGLAQPTGRSVPWSAAGSMLALHRQGTSSSRPSGGSIRTLARRGAERRPPVPVPVDPTPLAGAGRAAAAHDPGGAGTPAEALVNAWWPAPSARLHHPVGEQLKYLVRRSRPIACLSGRPRPAPRPPRPLHRLRRMSGAGISGSSPTTPAS